MNKLMLILAPALLIAGIAGGYLASSQLRAAAPEAGKETADLGQENMKVEAGRFAFILPGSLIETPSVFMVTLDVKAADAPESLARVRDGVNEVLVAALEMPIVHTDNDVLAKMQWAFPHVAQRIHPWIIGAELELAN